MIKQGIVYGNWRLGSGVMAWFNHVNPNGPKLVFKPQTLRPRYLLLLDNFIEFSL